ncbi:MAG: type II secretion system F family protein [Candidatus Korobacteraceae bacterium]|jgi:tight adherence protein B
MVVTVSLFIFFAVVTFAVVVFLTRPSATARLVERRLAGVRMPGNSGALGGGGPAEFLKQTILSEVKWLNQLLERWTLAHKLSVLLTQAESSWSVSTVLLASGILGAMGFFIARFWLVDLIPGLIAGTLAATLPILVLRAKGARRLNKFNQKLPDALDLMARALRAGHSVGAAIEIVAQEGGEPLRSEFKEVYKQQSFGLPQRDALLQLGRRVPSADLQIVITAMLVQKETGGNLVDILERTTAVLRDRMRIQGELRVRTAQGRLTGWILCLLPVVMFFLINAANPGYADVLVHDPVGRKLTYAGIGMMALGGLLIRKIVRIKV